MPSSLEAQFKEAMKKKQREILLAQIRDNPSLTIGELIGLRGEFGDVLKSLTVGELLSGSAGDGGGKRRKGSGRGAPSVADTRTKAARMAYDQSMYDVLSAAPTAMSAVELREVNGGTPDQARKALNRLIESGRITFSGKARGTRYTSL